MLHFLLGLIAMALLLLSKPGRTFLKFVVGLMTLAVLGALTWIIFHNLFLT